MKNLITVLITILLVNLSFAQEMEVKEENRSMSKGTQPSYQIELLEVSEKEAIAAWEKFTKDFKPKKKTKKVRKTKEYFTQAARMPRIADEPVDLYASFSENSNAAGVETIITVWFDRQGDFLSAASSAEASSYVEGLLKDYAGSTSKKHAETMVKEEEKELKKVENQLKKLEKDNKNYHKKIEDAKATIAKMEKNIEVNESDQKKQAGIIEDQKKKVEDAKDNLKQF